MSGFGEGEEGKEVREPESMCWNQHQERQEIEQREQEERQKCFSEGKKEPGRWESQSGEVQRHARCFEAAV